MTPLPWSHSALSDFRNCARQYYHKRVLKDVIDPPNEAGIWGDYAHKEFEAYLKHHRDVGPCELPSNLRQYTDYLDRILAGAGVMSVECKYAIDATLRPCAWNDPKVWCRAILDVLHVCGHRARVIDHKTGKRKNDDRQLKLCALMVFIHHDEVQEVTAGYTWLQEMQCSKPVVLRRGAEEDLWGEFMPDLLAYKRAFTEVCFTPRPSGLCNGWCPVVNCEFWKPKRRT